MKSGVESQLSMTAAEMLVRLPTASKSRGLKWLVPPSPVGWRLWSWGCAHVVRESASQGRSMRKVVLKTDQPQTTRTNKQRRQLRTCVRSNVVGQRAPHRQQGKEQQEESGDGETPTAQAARGVRLDCGDVWC